MDREPSALEECRLNLSILDERGIWRKAMRSLPHRIEDQTDSAGIPNPGSTAGRRKSWSRCSRACSGTGPIMRGFTDMLQDEAPVRCPEFSLERKWQVAVQTPLAAIGDRVSAIQEYVSLVQRAYSLCMFNRRSVNTRFKNRAGAHGGEEEDVREEPSISVAETGECLSVPQSDRENPNRFWNREDRDEIHGISAGPGRPAKRTSNSGS
ncbi:MAG: hypothetical protein OXN84_01855 [Albidovulum sp.]|nr:hypothetical protein [Albidovulum sp.]